MNRLESHHIPVADAADVLDVHPSRIRALIAHGRLDAQKLGGRWFVDRRSLEYRRSRSSVDGRPFGQANAWALLCLSQGGEPDWVSKWELSRLRRRLREDGLEQLAPRLWKRARKEQLRAHPSLLPQLREDPRLFPSGVSAAAEHRIDIVQPNEIEAYVGDGDLQDVVRDHYLEPSPNPNVLLHIAPSRWIRSCASNVMGPAVAALDLFEADDEKGHRAGREALAALIAAWREAHHDRQGGVTMMAETLERLGYAFTGVQVPGGTHGLQRSEPVEIRVGERIGAVPRPNLLGAILLKARAVDVDDVPESQREELCFLLSLVDDPVEMARDLRGKERSWLRRRKELLDPAHRAWLGIQEAEDARIAFRILTN